MKSSAIAAVLLFATVVPAAAQNVGIIGSQLGIQPQPASPCPVGGCLSANPPLTLNLTPTIHPVPVPVVSQEPKPVAAQPAPSAAR